MTQAPKKTLILHIGMGKTGTTAVQKAFWLNRAALAEAGIAYPAIGATSGAHHLISPHVLPHLAQGAPWRRFLSPSEWMPKVAALPEQRVFMSSELISSATPDAIAAFCAALTPVFDLRILIYLRRQDDMIAAVYAQGVRGGIQYRPFADVFDGRLAHYDYMDRLAPWVAALGRDHITVRPYERSQFHARDLIRDVALHGLGLTDLPPGFVHDPAADHNARLSIPALEFKRLVNILIPDRNRSHPYVAPLLTCPPDPRGVHLLGRSDRERLIAHFAASNARVAQIWLGRPEGDLFRDPLPPDAPGTASVPGPADLHAVAAHLAQAAPGLLHDLKGLVAAVHTGNHTGNPATRAAAATLAAACDGLTLPRKPLRHRLGQFLRKLRTPAPVAVPALSPIRTPARIPARAPIPAPPIQPRATPPAQQMLVHFGTHKTGSSSIQNTLFHNHDRLGETRYIAFGNPNSSLMVRSIFSTPDPGTVPQQKLRARFEACVHDSATAPRAIFSAEVICNLDANELARMISALSANGARLRYLGYLRDPVSFSRSVMQERLKIRYFAALPFLPDAPLTKDYHRIVDRLDALAGPDSVQVFPFDRALFPQGDVVRHFLNQAGIEPEGLTLHRVNDSLSATGVKALYAYRRLRIAQDSMIGSDATREDFIADLATLDGPAFQLSPDIEARIAAANTHILDWSEARLGHRLAAPPRSDDTGIRTEADMLTFSAEDLARLDALAEVRQVPGLPAGLSSEGSAAAVADLLHALRLRAAQAKPATQARPVTQA
jgi:hypothetical protein